MSCSGTLRRGVLCPKAGSHLKTQKRSELTNESIPQPFINSGRCYRDAQPWDKTRGAERSRANGCLWRRSIPMMPSAISFLICPMR